MGIFTEFQPLYAAHGIATFPMSGKKPAVKGYNRVTLMTSARMAVAFGEAAAMGFNAGPASKVSVIDIDSADEQLWRETTDMFGDTPIKVRTPSGGLHLWYRHDGEPRRIRFDPRLPIDILGGGVVVAPPSVSSKGSYEFIDGNLDLISLLKPANCTSPHSEKLKGESTAQSRKNKLAHGRNDHLFKYLMRQAASLDDLAELDELANDYVENFIDRTAGHPFTDAEIKAAVASVRRYTEEGKNRFGREAHLILPFSTRDQLLKCGSDAAYLHMVLAAWSSDKSTFQVANGMAQHMPSGAWTVPRFVNARNVLAEKGLIVLVRPHSRHSPALYRWP